MPARTLDRTAAVNQVEMFYAEKKTDQANQILFWLTMMTMGTLPMQTMATIYGPFVRHLLIACGGAACRTRALPVQLRAQPHPACALTLHGFRMPMQG